MLTFHLDHKYLGGTVPKMKGGKTDQKVTSSPHSNIDSFECID